MSAVNIFKRICSCFQKNDDFIKLFKVRTFAGQIPFSADSRHRKHKMIIHVHRLF